MKQITLSPREFENFKHLANQLEIIFMYSVDDGVITIEADTASLERLGF